jgi:3'(2'), 5'-bisphosphate nucleotidase
MGITALWQELEATLTPLLVDFRRRLDRLDISEKPDHTLLTEADLAVQDRIVAAVHAYDSGATIVAEEAGVQNGEMASTQRIWVVDPIDGTAEFVRPDRAEFCSVVCLLEDRRPTAALIIAPEIGAGRTAVTIRVDGAGSPIVVNGKPRAPITAAAPQASVTRSAGTGARPWERHMTAAGITLKTRTTSQTLDMVRTCVDLTDDSGGDLTPFALFYRENQKVWDGAAGRCLAYAAGLQVCDGQGRSKPTVDLDLTSAEPTFASTLVAGPELVRQFLAWSAG